MKTEKKVVYSHSSSPQFFVLEVFKDVCTTFQDITHEWCIQLNEYTSNTAVYATWRSSQLYLHAYLNVQKKLALTLIWMPLRHTNVHCKKTF